MSAQPYAGLLEKLRSLIPSGLYTGNSDFWYVNPDGPEAAEAISSLLNALEPFAKLQLPARCEGNAAFYSILHSHILAARAALNSDASTQTVGGGNA